MRASFIPFLLLGGCEAAPPATPWSSATDPTLARPDDTGPTDDDGDGWPVAEGDCDDGDPAIHPGADEDCANGTDDDCDGLLDCEDGACIHGAACDERGFCGDWLDNDADGLTDCEDDDCWWTGACVFTSRVRRGGRVDWYRNRGRAPNLGAGTATSVDGTLRIRPASPTTAFPVASCTWHVDRATFFGHSTAYGSHFVHGGYATRYGFDLSPGCPIGPVVSFFVPVPFPREGGVAGWGWDTNTVWVTSWYQGAANLLSWRTVTVDGIPAGSESWWSMASISSGSSFEIQGHGGGDRIR